LQRRVQRQTEGSGGAGIRWTLECQVDFGERVPAMGVVFGEGHGLLGPGEGFGGATVLSQGPGQIVHGLGIVGMAAQGLPVIAYRRPPVRLTGSHIAKVEQRQRPIPVEFRRPPVVAVGQVELAALDPLAYPATRALIPAFRGLDCDAAFSASVDAFIDGVSSRTRSSSPRRQARMANQAAELP